MIDKVLEERGSRYGKFEEHAKIAQALQKVLWSHPNWENMPTDSRQALVVICDKMARMLNGYHDYDDNWVDIIGYATLVLNRVRGDERKAKVPEIKITKEDMEAIKKLPPGTVYVSDQKTNAVSEVIIPNTQLFNKENVFIPRGYTEDSIK